LPKLLLPADYARNGRVMCLLLAALSIRRGGFHRARKKEESRRRTSQQLRFIQYRAVHTISALLTKRFDHVRDEAMMLPTLAIRVDAGAHDHQIMTGDHGHVLSFVTRGRERAGGHTGHLIQ